MSILSLALIISSSIGMAAEVVALLTTEDGGFGWSVGAIGAALMVYYLVGAAFAPVSGWLGNRYGARAMMIFGGSLYGVSMLLLGVITLEPSRKLLIPNWEESLSPEARSAPTVSIVSTGD